MSNILIGFFLFSFCWGFSFDSKASKIEAVGQKNIAVVLLDYANDGKSLSMEEIRKAIFSSEYSVAEYFSKASYGKTTLSGDIFGWIKPKKMLFGKGWTACWPLDQDKFNLLLEHYPKVDLLAYDGFIFLVHRKTKNKCAAGIANTKGLEYRPTYTQFGEPPNGKIKTRIMFASANFYFPYQAYSRISNSTVAHELIHTLGINNHSNAYVCRNKILSSNPYECEILAYGDIFSIMGLRSQASHPNSVNLERLGWLDETNLIQATETGEYTIYAIEDQRSNSKAIKIPLVRPIKINKDRFINYIYIEYKAMKGFNKRKSFFRKIQLRNNKLFSLDRIHGALIYAASCSEKGECLPYLLNMHPNSVDAIYKPNQQANAYLFEGESFDVPLNQIKISVLRVSEGELLTLNITFD